MENSIYLDNAATSKVDPAAVNAVEDCLFANFGNPSSPHTLGLQAEKIIKNARQLLAELLGIKSNEIVFTSGGTESNNLAIQGAAAAYKQRGNHLITSSVEHSSVHNVFSELEKEGWEVDRLGVDKKGRIDLKELKSLLREDTVLVSLIHVSNELGTIEPVYKAAEIIKNNNQRTIFHVDGVQAFAKIYSKLNKSKIDLYSISGHKIHAPKGVGALFIRKGVELRPLVFGGGQENQLRSGTENVPAIAGLGAVLAKIKKITAAEEKNKKLFKKRDYLLQKLKQIENIHINSPADGAPHIINISLTDIRGETMVHALEAENIYVSTGSACTSDSAGSRILNACGLSRKRNLNALRISLSEEISEADLDKTVEILKEKIDFLSF